MTRETGLPDQAEVAVVGGGYAGLSAALTLARLGHRPVVLDGERIGWGASSRNGGQVSGKLKVGRARLAAMIGAERAEAAAHAIGQAVPHLTATITREGIDCDWRQSGRFTAAWTRGHYEAQARAADAIAAAEGIVTRMVPRARQREELGSDHYRGGMVADGTGSVHPGKLARGMAEAASRAGAVLVDRTRVGAIGRDGGGFLLDTSRGPLRANAVLVTTNGYTMGEDGSTPMPFLARRVIPVASYIIATEPLAPGLMARLFPTNRMIGDSRRVLNYFRASPDGTRVLWGGRASFSETTPAQAAPVLHRMMGAVFPELRRVGITHSWTGNVAFTFDWLPHLGVQDGVHYAAGCQGSGVAVANWMGHQAALKLAGAANEPFPLDSVPFPTKPFYKGRPWFLPVVGGWYRLRDGLDRLVA